MNNKLHTLVVILISMLGQVALAQGILKGRITEATDATEGVAFANIILEGTQIGTTSDMDGYYEISAPAGTYTVQGSFIGYDPCTKKNIVITEGQTNTLNFSIAESTFSLDVAVLEVKADRENETAIMIEQKNKTEIAQAIGSAELSKKGLGDVAEAVDKVTGISKQEGSGGVFVRGLGDRYNSTTFNGLPLPSNNPSKKNIALDLFNTDIVQVIGINKIFGPTVYGDLGGANINIESKVHDGEPYVNVKVGTSLSTEALGTSDFLMQDGPSATGFSSPTYEKSFITRSGFNSSWDPNTAKPIGFNFAINGGRSFEFKNKSKLNLFATASHASDYSFKEGIIKGGVNKEKIITSEYNFKNYTNSTNSTAMLNLDYEMNDNTELKFNSLFINSANQKVEDYRGLIHFYDIEGENGFIRRQTYDKTSLLVNQLLGTHELKNDVEIKWGLANNYVKNIIPDRKQNMFVQQDINDVNSPMVMSDLNTSDNHRYFQDLVEVENALNLSARKSFIDDQSGNDDELGFIEVGYSGRFKNVDFEVVQFNMAQYHKDKSQYPVANLDNVDGYFSASNYGTLFESITFRGGEGSPVALDPQTYNGTQFIHAGYAKGQYQLNSLFTASAGIRFESIYQQVEWNTAINRGEETLENTKFLPSLSLKYTMSETDNLKFGFSKSYTLPQYKERAQFQFEDVTTVFVGNPDLYASDNYNVDLKWESYPKPGTMYSATVYGKHIQNPINEIMVASAANDISYLNTGKVANIAGLELEFNQRVLDFAEENSSLKNNLTLNLNASWMAFAEQDLDGEKVKEESNYIANFTESTTGITGASDLLVNGDIMYFVEKDEHKNFLASLSLGYFSDRIVSIGSQSRGNLIDKGFMSLNLNLKTQLSEHIKIGISAKNLLNPSISRVQDIQDVEVLNYKKGRFFGFNLTYMM